MHRFTYRRAITLFAAWFFVVMSAAEANDASSPDSNAKSDEPAAEADESRLRGWQVFIAAANLWPKLEESEARIDRLINDGVGKLFPRWEEPRTFSDWREDFMLWDFQLGIGRDLTPKWTWYAAVGGTLGHQPNSKMYYPFFIVPLKVDVDFYRTVQFVTSGVDYYPWGAPEYPEDGPSILACLRAARPYVEGAVGYVHLKGRAEGKFKIPGIGEILHYQDKADYDLLYFSPRVGVDVPISKHNSVSLAAGPLAFTTHDSEFDNISIYTVLRHRF